MCESELAALRVAQSLHAAAQANVLAAQANETAAALLVQLRQQEYDDCAGSGQLGGRGRGRTKTKRKR